jgi:hypothetical protein
MAINGSVLKMALQLKMAEMGIPTNFIVGYSEKVLQAVCEVIVDHIVTYLEVHGVTTLLDVNLDATGLPVETYNILGIGDHNGTLQTSMGSVIGSVRSGNKDTSTQNNTGTVK